MKIKELLPSCAFQVNGTFIEDMIPGYHTLNADGQKNLIEKELFTADANIRSGAIFINSRYPERTINIEYFIEGTGWEDLQEKYTNLMKVLDMEDVQIIFNGESDKFIKGYFAAETEIETTTITRHGNFNIVCLNPFKYSTAEYEVTASGGTFNVNYDGTYKAYPTMIAEFPATYDADGNQTNTSECGYVGYAKQDGAMLQFGDPNETDWAEITQPADEVINRSFRSLAGWTLNNSMMLDANYYVEAGSLGVGSGGSQYWTYPTAYGSGSNYHGPSMRWNLTDTTIDTDFEFEFRHDFTATKAQFGCFQCLLYDSSNHLIAGVNIQKTTKDAKAKVYVYGGSTSPKGNNTIKCASVETSMMKKSGKKVTFYIAGKTQTIALDDSTAAKIVRKVVFYFGKNGTKTAIGTNRLYYCSMLRKPYEDVQNTFQPGDVLTVDTESASVYLDKGSALIPAPNLGALGNDWETFCLIPGNNVIAADYSDFTTTPPIFKMKYRKRYL